MGVDLNGPAVEIAIGLAFVFFLLSILVSAVTEGISWLTKQRAAKLEEGLKGMLGDEAVLTKLLEHPLVRTDLSLGKVRKPSYLSARNFALSLTDVLQELGGEKESAAAEVDDGIGSVNADLEAQLRALPAPVADGLDAFRKAAEAWFDDAMDRVSGWYKRWAQAIACVVALIVAVGLNANAIGIAERLANEPTVRAAVVSRAEAIASEEKGDVKDAGQNTSDAVEELEALNIPLLWDGGTSVDLKVVIGWLITALAISLGAPFWFDALGKLSRLRTAGKRPAPTSTA